MDLQVFVLFNYHFPVSVGTVSTWDPAKWGRGIKFPLYSFPLCHGPSWNQLTALLIFDGGKTLLEAPFMAVTLMGPLDLRFTWSWSIAWAAVWEEQQMKALCIVSIPQNSTFRQHGTWLHFSWNLPRIFRTSFEPSPAGLFIFLWRFFKSLLGSRTRICVALL